MGEEVEVVVLAEIKLKVDKETGEVKESKVEVVDPKVLEDIMERLERINKKVEALEEVAKELKKQ